MVFSERIKELRKEKGITQIELADAMGLSKGTVAMWEVGKREANFDTLDKLSVYFQVSVDYLLGRTDINPQNMNVSICADFLGITEETAKKLKEICCDENGKRKDFAISIGCFIQSPEFCKLVECIEMVNSTSFDLYKKFIN